MIGDLSEFEFDSADSLGFVPVSQAGFGYAGNVAPAAAPEYGGGVSELIAGVRQLGGVVTDLAQAGLGVYSAVASVQRSRAQMDLDQLRFGAGLALEKSRLDTGVKLAGYESQVALAQGARNATLARSIGFDQSTIMLLVIGGVVLFAMRAKGGK